MATQSSQKLSAGEKLGYSLGDAATNFFFLSMILYQSRYYTDTVGLAASSVGWLLFFVRWVDAIVDPVVGALSDRTETRWGKFRPWVLWTAVPFGVIFWLVYSVPALGGSGKLIYVWVTYLLLMMVYSANNTPYAALTGVMTSDPSERTSISTYRLCIAIIGQLLIQGLALPLVDKFGNGDSAHGWSVTIGIFAVAMVIFYFVAFASTRERVRPNPHQKSSVKRDLADVFTCRPWVVMFFLTLFVFTTLALRGGALNYFFSYYLDRGQVTELLRHVGLVSSGGTPSTWETVLNWFGLMLKPDGSNATSVGFSLFNMAGTLVQIPGILLSQSLSDRFGKRNVFIIGLALTTIVTAAIFISPATAVNQIFLLGILWGVFYGPTVPLLWAMIADVPDYAEWKTSRRATGFCFAGIVFALKAGLGLGGALLGWLLGAYGYVPNVAQSASALQGIRLSATIFSAIPFALGVVCLFAYPITKELSLRIRDELAARRQKYSEATS
jgi:Na+/melibiose symporter-like transporter